MRILCAQVEFLNDLADFNFIKEADTRLEIRHEGNGVLQIDQHLRFGGDIGSLEGGDAILGMTGIERLHIFGACKEVKILFCFIDVLAVLIDCTVN